MKTYEEAVYAVAEEYAHVAHDSMFPRVNIDKCKMIAFIFGVDLEDVVNEVNETFFQNREVFWK
jgi:predicted ATPase